MHPTRLHPTHPAHRRQQVLQSPRAERRRFVIVLRHLAGGYRSATNPRFILAGMLPPPPLFCRAVGVVVVVVVIVQQVEVRQLAATVRARRISFAAFHRAVYAAEHHPPSSYHPLVLLLLLVVVAVRLPLLVRIRDPRHGRQHGV